MQAHVPVGLLCRVSVSLSMSVRKCGVSDVTTEPSVVMLHCVRNNKLDIYKDQFVSFMTVSFYSFARICKTVILSAKSFLQEHRARYMIPNLSE
jgi:hypothetical protein